MTNIERANRWYEIITRLTDITKSSADLKKWLIALHYITFATDMWMMHTDKYMREN